FAYKVMHDRFELLKEKNELLNAQLITLKENAPDILAQRLAERSRALTDELGRLNADHEASQATIRNKEIELAEVKAQISNLKNQLEKAQDLLQTLSEAGLVCPKCGAPQSVRERYSESVEYQGYDVDVDREVVSYECGLEMVDGKVTSQCMRSDAEQPET
ncbi:MAG TPA: hypothetical protein VII97_03850, partial [Anaerolineales bacterium]